MPGPVRLSDSGESDNYDPSYAVQLSDSPESDNRLHTMGNGTSFFLVTVRLCNVCICLTGPKYRQSTLHSLYSKTSEQPETLALTSTVIHGYTRWMALDSKGRRRTSPPTALLSS